MEELSYESKATCLISSEGKIIQWLPRGLPYKAARSLAELQLAALCIYRVDVTYRVKPKSQIKCEETQNYRVYFDKTKALIDRHNNVQMLFRRGEIFKRSMQMAEEMGLSVNTVSIEVTEVLEEMSKKSNGELSFFEDFRINTL